ncbi:hypothetical protein CS062_17525 [Roseateles chitinivorans]|uniref:Uncharacterized protein n=1 Tax=Roseateles chitinivorans TaxID=2917965 RepID=A0A2G9C6F9_9BURK|nr:hypothetical protein CS062_17525 [Roseateles chitinivorans]
MSADLAKVSNTLSFTAKTAMERGRQLHALTREIEAAKAMLPRNSALMRPQAMKVGGERRDQVYADAFSDESPSLEQFDAAMPVEAVSYDVVPLDVLLTDVERDYLKRKLHARVQFAGADLFYAISPSALQSMGGPGLADRLAQEIARQMVPALMRELGLSRRPGERGR